MCLSVSVRVAVAVLRHHLVAVGTELRGPGTAGGAPGGDTGASDVDVGKG